MRFPPPLTDRDANLAARVKEALVARHLVLETDGALIVIPVGSVKYFQCFPAPRKLPAYAIKGVSFNHES